MQVKIQMRRFDFYDEETRFYKLMKLLSVNNSSNFQKSFYFSAVVYLDKRLGAAHSKRCSFSAFSELTSNDDIPGNGRP